MLAYYSLKLWLFQRLIQTARWQPVTLSTTSLRNAVYARLAWTNGIKVAEQLDTRMVNGTGIGEYLTNENLENSLRVQKEGTCAWSS